MLPKRGEIWQVDFGMMGKVCPALVINVPFEDVDRALFSFVPHTTRIRGSRFEVAVTLSALDSGAFMVQGLTNLPGRAALRRLGVLSTSQLSLVEDAVRAWLGL